MGGGKGKKKGGTASDKKAENLRDYVDKLEDPHLANLSTQERREFPLAAIQNARNNHPDLITKVDFSSNLLQTLPDTIGVLDQIISLNLSYNKLIELPESFGDLVNLKRLDLFDNQLTKLPYHFSNLKELRWLNLGGNSFKEGFLDPSLVALNTNDQECMRCAKLVLARMTDLSAKKKKNDARLARKREREEAAEAARQKAVRQIEKDQKKQQRAHKREEWERQQKELVAPVPDNTGKVEVKDYIDSMNKADSNQSGGCCSTFVSAIFLLLMVCIVAIFFATLILTIMTPNPSMSTFIAELSRSLEEINTASLSISAFARDLVHDARKKLEL